MAGMGPAPVPPDQKRRRNKDSLAELPSEGYQGEFPALPASYKLQVWVPGERGGGEHVTRTVKFLPSTRAWYEAWARSPMATEFTTVHWLRLQSLAKLQDRFDRGDMKVDAELRQGLAGFGGSPLDVRRLGRSIAPRSERPQAPAPRAGQRDRRARLSVVAS
jgi:hypothetical protein